MPDNNFKKLSTITNFYNLSFSSLFFLSLANFCTIFNILVFTSTERELYPNNNTSADTSRSSRDHATFHVFAFDNTDIAISNVQFSILPQRQSGETVNFFFLNKCGNSMNYI